MRIIAYPLGSDLAIVLAGSLPEETVEGLDGAHDWLGEASPGVEAAEMAQRDNGNASDSLGFRVSRSHATAQVAALFYLDHPASVPHIGRVVIEVLNDAGAVMARRVIAKAAIRVAREGWSVCATVMTYRIEGGLIKTS